MNQPAVQRETMKTIGGMSVRNEIDARIEAARADGEQLGIESAVAFLAASGYEEAAAALSEALAAAVAARQAEN